jgi:hypothetical protein
MSIVTVERPRILDRLGAAGRPSKKTKANRRGEARRIELLGQMWERRKVALGARDKVALEKLAKEDEDLGHGCPDTASQIMAEAMSIADVV